MNREIKFRAWNGKCMLFSDNGDFYLMPNNHVDIPSLSGHEFYRKDYPIMQYTGLKDCNGKDIYEGDVVKVLRGSPESLANIYQIKYTNAAFQMWGKGNETPTAFVTYAKHAIDNGIEFEEIGDLIEVIGNIHYNPELL